MNVEDTVDNSEQCVCPGCPTYDRCMSDASEALYCARSETVCEPEAKSCLCGGCPVWAVSGLEEYYYCLRGTTD